MQNSSRDIASPLLLFFLVVCWLSLCACAGPGDSGKPPAGAVRDGSPQTGKPVFFWRARHSSDFPGEWLLAGRNYQEQRFSPLTAINQETVSDLGLAWYIDLPRDGGQESTPLMVDGVLYFSSAWSVVHAVDAATGERLWSFDPQVPKITQARACCGPVNRGVAYWEGKVFVGAFDGRLIALDARTGAPLWSVDTVADANNYSSNRSYTITGAPRIAGDKVVIGNGGAEYGVRGYVSAYDTGSGELAWRFYTVPGDPSRPFENRALEWAAKTWHGEWWKVGGGGTVWDSMTYDPDLNLLYIGVGNSSPWNPNIRSAGEGDNLFVSSIVALDADSGDYVWHYQTTPGDAWDYTATQHMILADLEIAGSLRKVIMQAPKNGFFYVLDRESGELLSAEAFVPVTWASHVDLKSGRPVVQPEARYWVTGEPVRLTPSAGGAHNWHPMAFNPLNGLVYVPAVEMSARYAPNDGEQFAPFGRNTGMEYEMTRFPKDREKLDSLMRHLAKGYLLAWDPVGQREVWRREQRFPHAGGVLATAGGLVFQGTVDGYFRAMDADTGEIRWEHDAQTSVKAPAVTYLVGDEQYLAVVVGRGGQSVGGRTSGDFTPDFVNRSRLLVYRLGGRARLPMPDEPRLDLQDLTAVRLDEDRITAGGVLYSKHCRSCHGISAVGNTIVPDLRYSGFLPSVDLWQKVVKDGILAQQGMAGFGRVMTAEQIENVRQYVVHENQRSIRSGDRSRIGR